MMQGAFVAIGGNLLNEAILQKVEIQQRLNQHWTLEIECRAAMGYAVPGEGALGTTCTLSNTAEDGTTHMAFAGTVIDVAIKQEVWGSFSSVIFAVSNSWLIDHSRRNAYHGSASISAVANQLGGAAGGVSSNVPEKTSPAEYVQFGETNWQFLLRLADDHGGWVRAGLGGLEISNTFDAPEPLIFRDHYGLIEFYSEGVLGPAKVAAAQYDSAMFSSQTWPGEQQPAQLEAGGQRMGAAVAAGSAQQALLGFTERSRSWTNEDMAARARFEAERGQGAGVLAGGTSRQHTLTAGGAIAVQNCKDADGTYYLLEVTHVWTRKGYLNHFVATSWKNWHATTRPHMASAPGVQVGRVVATQDPLNRGRLTVSLFWQDGASLLWAPMTSLHSGAGFGLTVMPEIGDEVLVSFLDGDPERPVILGSLWNGVQQPPREQFATADESQNNLVKRLMTKSGIRIHIVDTPGIESISLATPRSNHLLLSEKAAETGRPVIALETLGDIHFRAAGRTHELASFHSRHVDGQDLPLVNVEFRRVYWDGSPIPNIPYVLSLAGGKSAKGRTDGSGFAQHSGMRNGTASVIYGDNTNKFKSSCKAAIHQDFADFDAMVNKPASTPGKKVKG